MRYNSTTHRIFLNFYRIVVTMQFRMSRCSLVYQHRIDVINRSFVLMLVRGVDLNINRSLISCFAEAISRLASFLLQNNFCSTLLPTCACVERMIVCMERLSAVLERKSACMKRTNFYWDIFPPKPNVYRWLAVSSRQTFC